MRTVKIYDLTDEQWEAFFAMRKAIHRKYYAKIRAAIMEMDLPRFKEVSLQSIRTLNAHEYIFFPDDLNEAPFGWMRCFSGNDDLLFQHDTLLNPVPEEMLQEIAQLLLARLEDDNKQSIITGCTHPRLVNAVRTLSPASESPLLVMILKPEDLIQEKVDEWAAEAEKWEGKLRFEFVTDRPEEYLDAYVELQNKLLRDMPMEGGPVEYNSWSSEGLRRLNRFNSENNQTSYSIFVLDNEGQLIGNSDMVIRRKPLKLQQGMTGLLPEYRGKGLAKILKALMLKRIIDDFPDFDRVITTTSPLNMAMQHINEAVGFKVDKKMYEFVIYRDALEAYAQRTAEA